MVLIRKSFNFCLHLPIAYYCRDVAINQPFVLDYLYNRQSDYYFRNYKFIYSLEQYYHEVESVMRGLLVKDTLLASVNSWHYLQTTNCANSNQLCSLLIQMNSFSQDFNRMLYGKKDIFLNNVPVECLYQFFNHLSFDKFLNLIIPYCEIVDESFFRQKNVSLIPEVFKLDYLIRRSLRANCFYLEDLLEDVDLCESIISRLNKPEITYTFNYLLRFLNK